MIYSVASNLQPCWVFCMWRSVTKSSGGADGAQRTDSRAVSQPNKRKKVCALRGTHAAPLPLPHMMETLCTDTFASSQSPSVTFKPARTAHTAGEMCLPTRNNEKQLCVRTPLCVSPRAAPFLLSMINCVGGNSKLLRRTQSSFITHEHTLEV